MKPHKQYILKKRAFLEKKPCAVYPSLKATEVHHIRGRLGPLLEDQQYWLAVSTQGHRWIHNNPVKARELGFMAQPGDWNRTPRSTNTLPPA